MHHGFPYRSETETKQEDSLPDPLDSFPPSTTHQRQQQDQLQLAAGPSNDSPFRVRLTVPAGFSYKSNPQPVGNDDNDDDEFEAEEDADADADADASIDETYITEQQQQHDDDDEMVNARDLDPTSDDVKPVRRSSRRHSNHSGSEYTAQTDSTGHANGATTTSQRGRTHAVVDYNEDNLLGYGDDDDDDDVGPRRSRSSKTKAAAATASSTRAGSSRRERDLSGFVEPDPDEERRLTRLQVRKEEEKAKRRNEPRKLLASDPHRRPAARQTRNSARGRVVRSSDDEYAEDDDGEGEDEEDDEAASEAVHTTPSPIRPTDDRDEDAEGEPDHDEEPVRATRRATRRTQRKRKNSLDEDEDDRAYSLRPRGNVNYRIPMPLEDLPMDPKDRLPPQRARPKGRAGPSVAFGSLPFPPRADDSDSDGFTRTPRRPMAGAGGGGLFSAGAGGGIFPSDLAAAAGTPSNLGRLSSGDAAALADVDPLGVNQNVTFDEVGGLDEHIASLKEMTLLPLLYPELFQKFNVTPPRGVLFHGPPGTGKTLLARALAASCRSGGRQIAFFMRKGADCLSKWVGEAERQLRLLFEEARASQPSIIFFDEIDGLAPVRSSKQDQIHASIVSTLLALMDGMDGRGQVIVIGATNRPDAIDPALRRPGRFDREFFFPLPDIHAREKILRIHTKGWDGWAPGDPKVEETIKGLAKITQGYGGADLRALCTEATLNAVQRRYPQIYSSADRLVVDADSVRAEARDFMVSIKKLVPSSARSVSSTAAPLPTQLVPLLEEPLNSVKAVLDRIIPRPKQRNVLEEAQWEDEPAMHAGGGLDRELMLQTMETLRIHRPRLVIHGPPGMGQAYLGAAALHHLESFTVQSLDLGALISDPVGSIEAAIVQLFAEAKRNQPSIIYIPSLMAWSTAVAETALKTTKSMLDSLAPTDPVLLLAVVDGPWNEVPQEIRSWFGFRKDNRVALDAPTSAQRERFFQELMDHVRRPPSEFPGASRRRKRVLEVLPVAPPLAPRQPTEAELRNLEENDVRLIAQLKHRLSPVLADLKRRFKRFTKAAEIEYGTDALGNLYYVPPAHAQPAAPAPEENPPSTPNTNGMVIDVDSSEPHPQPNGTVVNGHSEPEAPVAPTEPAPPPAPDPAHPTMHLIDLERIHVSLYKSKYLTPLEFLEDLHKIVENADNMKHYDSERFFKAQAMYTTAEVHAHEFEAAFVQECNRMAPRERKRREDYRKMRAEAKQAAKAVQDALQPPPPPGARRSARNNGQEPELAITDPVELERKLKRQRSTESAVGGASAHEDDVEGRANKRQRTNEPADVFGAVAAPVIGTSDAVAMDVDLVAGSSSNAMLAPEPFVLPTPPSTLANLLNPAPPLPPQPRTDILMDHAPPFEPAKIPTPPPPRPPTPSPSPGPPPVFMLSESLADAFQAKLVSQTGGLSVEQLEQLRAACFDCVWRHRADWDRDGAVHEMDGIVDEFLSAVALEDQEDDVG